MAVKERSQIKGTDAQIKAFAGHNGVLAFATDTKSLHVLSGTAGTTTEFLPSNKLKAVATSGSYNDLSDKPVVDSALSSTSENPVQNKVVKSAIDGKLSTSGGTVNGAITFANGVARLAILRGAGMKDFEIRGADNDGYMRIFPGETADYSQKKSASLLLSSTECTLSYVRPGAFDLTAMDATTGGKTLHGDPNGSLSWCGQGIISVVAESYGANSWYRKYSDGWIEQGGTSGTPDNQSSVVITFPIAFSNAGYTITFCNNMGYHVWLSNKTTTNFTYSRSQQQTGGMGIWWYACGK